MSILNLIIWILWGGSLIGIAFMIYKKIPAVMALPEESLEYNETFIDFLRRKKSMIPLRTDKAKIAILIRFNNKLVRLKELSLNVHNQMHSWTETLNKKLHHSKKIEETKIILEEQPVLFITYDKSEENSDDREKKA